MTIISGAKYTIFLTLTTFTLNANAEYYIQCCEQPATVVYITCVKHHCSWSSSPPPHRYSHSKHHHVVKQRYVKHTHTYRSINKRDNCCNLDMATGDDNPCQYPEMQIN